MKYVIIGGVAGGASAAARLRRLDEEAEILLFERGDYISYANCGLPYYIGGVIEDRERLFVQTPRSFGERFRVGVRVRSEVERIDTEKKEITVKELSTGKVYTEDFDKLILSPGAAPVKPPLEGIGQEGIFTLRNVNDTDHIKAFIDRKGAKRAVIVGAGFIGLEMAENLRHLGMEVTVVEMADQVMTPVDFEIAAVVHQHFKVKHTGLLLGEAVTAFKATQEGLAVELRSGKRIPADIVVLSIGVRPEIQLAKEAGLEIGSAGGIKVNEYLQTSHPDVYAVGDAIEFPHFITGKAVLTFLAGPANKQARICADNIVSGNKQVYKGAIGTAIAKVFDLTVGAAGVSAKLLDKWEIPYKEVIVHMASHAGYYPGAIPLTIKVNFSPEDGRLLGGQAVGYDGVDKRLEMLAAVIRQKGTVYDLMELEQAYAPPFSSAKDPVNMAGFVADNLLSGRMESISWKELKELDKQTITLINVCTYEECELGTIPGSLNIPLNELRGKLNTLPKEKPVVVYCAVGLRGYIASRILKQNGFSVRNLSGGLKTYETVTARQNNESGSMEVEEVPVNPEEKTERRVVLDACGLQCPGPVMKLKQGMDGLAEGDQLVITATDTGFVRDVESWTKMTGNRLLDIKQEKGVITAILEKGKVMPAVQERNEGGKTLIVFSDDLDKALAAFVIANGAAATGKKVTLFFTFWGLNIIKKKPQKPVEKDLTGKMFGFMLPSGSRKLSLSKMNMLGIGSGMMRSIMKKKKIDSLEELMEKAQSAGVELIACQMSMDVMGIKAEELMEGVGIGGVATYLERAENSNLNLFI